MPPELRENGDPAEVSPVSVAGSEGAAEGRSAREREPKRLSSDAREDQDEREEGEVPSGNCSDVDKSERVGGAARGEEEEKDGRGRKRVLGAEETPAVRRAAVSALPPPRFSSTLSPHSEPSPFKKFRESHAEREPGRSFESPQQEPNREDHASAPFSPSSPARGATSALPRRTPPSSTLDLPAPGARSASSLSSKHEAAFGARSSRDFKEETRANRDSKEDDRRGRDDERKRADGDRRDGRDERRAREEREGRDERRGREDEKRGREEERRREGREDRDGRGGRERDRGDTGIRRGESQREKKEEGEDEQGKARPASWTSVLRAPERNNIRSLEDVLTKQKTEEQPTRIMFMTKKQREQQKAADERRQLEMEKKKERQLLQNRKNFLMQQEIEKEREVKEKLKQREMEKIKEEQERRLRAVRGSSGTSRNKAEEEREAKRQAEEKKGGSSGRRGESSLADLRLLNLPEQELRARQQERELEQIRNHYLGMRTEKKKIQKPSEKFRNIFNFEWNDAEDTCKGDNNPLYQERMEPQLLFGRGRQEHQKAEESRGAAEAAAAATEAVRAARDAQASRVREKENAEDNRGHWTTKKREEMNERDWRIFREDFEIYIKGGRVPPPIRTWAESALPWELIEAVKHANYERPTPIQMQAIPIALEQRDLIGIAETGSGKTAAFVLPMLTYVKGLPPLNEETGQDGPYALILAPSRELAIQIDEETQKFASFCKCQTVAVVGGRSAETQAFQLRRGAEIVIGTPGRVKDCLEKAYTVLNQCNYVVLDEADRMIDMGFEEIVNFILDQIPTSNLKSNDEALILQQEMQAKAGHRLYRLTQMFSATMPPAVERLARYADRTKEQKA
ncbi:dead-box helicase family protein, related [Neospora caninum Liverpool]|uniref:Dead-box helicase family protein, related n=1 Tax=Neospora caninum (strain Liverpool) TaxID=572307 RepID=F0V923_NEOCL|nr:dead-box helicase family protein, related [Neospora caninum Liverpool]CBZ50214.1 dead-box helicase family protein, related [Neospora caninum Liverpool]|eukprot:XP_003880249.1 dead-box helicase family protein, related [Neospora caninum Liverpool]